ncbi:hypothetical protein ACFQY8_03200 [Alloscardovia venturai]|uniref:Lipoprotein n=1 Tax=Alloscardovia venturai TaxID=1769421 RepID=A0ABW2Y5W7_9BIFI
MRSVRNQKVIQHLFSYVCLILIVILSGCSGLPKETAPRIDVGKYVVAIPVYDAAKVPRDRSYVVFIDAQGKTQSLPIKTMFYNQPVWTESGIQFVDDTANYFLSFDNSTVQATPYKKTDFQYGSTYYDKSTMVSILNRGSDAEEEDGVIAVSRVDGHYAESSYSTADAHALNNLATCNGNTYTIDLSRDIENPQLVVSLIYDGKHPQYRVLSKVRPQTQLFDVQLQQLFENSPKVTNETNIGTAFCVNGKLAAFVTVSASAVQDRVSNVMLFEWDPQTKESSFIPLKDYNLRDKYLMTTQETEWSTFSSDESASFGDSVLLMSAVTGRIISVNTQTGETCQFSTPLVKYNAQYETNFYGRLVLRTTQKCVYAIVLNENDSTGKTSFINVYDRSSGKHIHTIPIRREIARMVYDTSFKFGYPAVNPRYIW